MSIPLKQARIIAAASIGKGRELDLKPLSVVILDPRTSLVACNSEEGVSQMRWRIAQGKANAAIQLGMGSRALMVRAEQQAYFIQSMNGLADGEFEREMRDYAPSTGDCKEHVDGDETCDGPGLVDGRGEQNSELPYVHV